MVKDLKVIARRNRRWWYAHAFVFVVGHYLIWLYDGNHNHDLMFYLEGLSWWKEGSNINGTFQSEAFISIFSADTIISGSHPLFASKKK